MAIPVAALQFILVGMLWGCTNPFLNTASAATASSSSPPPPPPAARSRARSRPPMVISSSSSSSLFWRWVLAVHALLLNWRFAVPFAVNQAGSVLYMVVVAQHDLSMAKPSIDALTFVFTALTSRLLGERALSASAWLGMALIIAGVAICSVPPPPIPIQQAL
jgi:drug/metabolite transporter (DMT)-like permease